MLIGLRDFLKANHHMPSSNRFNHSELACLKFIISVYRNEAMTISKTQHTQPRQPYFSSSEESSSTPCLICFTRSYSQSDWSVLIAISFLTNQLSEIWVYDQKKVCITMHGPELKRQNTSYLLTSKTVNMCVQSFCVLKFLRQKSSRCQAFKCNDRPFSYQSYFDVCYWSKPEEN